MRFDYEFWKGDKVFPIPLILKPLKFVRVIDFGGPLAIITFIS